MSTTAWRLLVTLAEPVVVAPPGGSGAGGEDVRINGEADTRIDESDVRE